MYKKQSTIDNRKEFIKLAIDDRNKAADILIERAEKLRRTDKVHNVAKILSEILFLHHCTIYRDCSR